MWIGDNFDQNPPPFISYETPPDPLYNHSDTDWGLEQQEDRNEQTAGRELAIIEQPRELILEITPPQAPSQDRLPTIEDYYPPIQTINSEGHEFFNDNDIENTRSVSIPISQTEITSTPVHLSMQVHQAPHNMMNNHTTPPLNLPTHRPKSSIRRMPAKKTPSVKRVTNKTAIKKIPAEKLPGKKPRMTKIERMSMTPEEKTKHIKKQNRTNTATYDLKQKKKLEDAQNKNLEVESLVNETKYKTQLRRNKIVEKYQVLSERYNTHYFYGSFEDFVGKLQQEEYRKMNEITAENREDIGNLKEMYSAAEKLIETAKGSSKTRAKQSAKTKMLEYQNRCGEVEIEKLQAISETLEQIAMHIDQFVLENGIPDDIFHDGLRADMFEPP